MITYTPAVLLRILVKAALLFVLANAVFAVARPNYGALSLYNGLLPGRERLPYGENPDAYTLSLTNLDALLASHVVMQPAAADEYRVLVLGDSATWGILQRPDETVTARLNALDLRTQDGRRMRFYNLGYPTMSLSKDLLLLDAVLARLPEAAQPDAVYWIVTAQSFPREAQIDSPLVQRNADAMRRLIATYDLNLDPQDSAWVERGWWDATIVGARRELADWLRLQVYGFTYAATGIDHVYLPYTPRSEDFDTDTAWTGSGFRIEPASALDETLLAWDVLDAGAALLAVRGLPLVLINEPIFVSAGTNSELRYNFFYPRWAYDQYRERLTMVAAAHDLPLIDAWSLLHGDAFTDSPVHLTPAGAEQFAREIARLGRD